MHKEQFQKSIEVIDKLKSKDVTKIDKYIDDKGLMCFNGHIFKCVLGMKQKTNESMVEVAMETKWNDTQLSNMIQDINMVHHSYIRKRTTFKKAKEDIKSIIQHFI